MPTGIYQRTEKSIEGCKRAYALRKARGDKIGFQKGTKVNVGRKHSYKSRTTKGRRLSPELCKKYSEVAKKNGNGKWMKFKTGENANNWQGGINPEHRKLRTDEQYILWRNGVFVRDGWSCQVCLTRGGNLQAHHIINFCNNKDLRCDINNGVTLCKNCHRDFHKEYGYKNNNAEQLQYYIRKRNH